MTDEILALIYAKLNEINPECKIIPVDSLTDLKTLLLIPQGDVCYATSFSDRVGYQTMLVTINGEKYYNNLSLGDLEEKLKNNPNFIRTKKQYIVNLNNITKVRINRARDLWFKGTDKPVINAVAPGYLQEFKDKYVFSV